MNKCVYIYIYIHIQGQGWGFPGTQLFHIKMDFENVDFVLVFTMFYGFESMCRTMVNVTCCADKLQVYPRRNILMLHNFPGGKKCSFHFSLGIVVSCICCRFVDY